MMTSSQLQNLTLTNQQRTQMSNLGAGGGVLVVDGGDLTSGQMIVDDDDSQISKDGYRHGA
jgi:hypothetical protein